MQRGIDRFTFDQALGSSEQLVFPEKQGLFRVSYAGRHLFSICLEQRLEIQIAPRLAGDGDGGNCGGGHIQNRELNSLAVNFHAESESARAHCCLTDEQDQDAIPGPVKESARKRLICF